MVSGGDTAASLPVLTHNPQLFGVTLLTNSLHFSLTSTISLSLLPSPSPPPPSFTYGSSGVNSMGSCVNWGSKFVGSVSESILGLYGGVTCFNSN